MANVFLVIQRLLHIDAFHHQVSKLAFLFPDASPISSFATRLTVSAVSGNSPGNTSTSTSITFCRNALFVRLICCWSFFFTITSHGVGSFFLHTTILCCLVTFPMRPLDVSYGYRYIFDSCCLNNWCTSYKSKFYYFTKLIDNLTYLTLVRCLLHVGDSAFVANYVAILLYVIKKTLLNNIYRKPLFQRGNKTQYHYRPRKVILDCICLTQTIIITTHTWNNNE